MFKKYSIAAGAALAVGLAGMVAPAVAKVEGDTIILGSALSLTGKYSTNGFHTQKGYDFAVDRINSMGPVFSSFVLLRKVFTPIMGSSPVCFLLS